MRAFLARHRADLLQILGGALLVVGIGLIFGYAVALALTGAGVVAYGIAKEREQ